MVGFNRDRQPTPRANVQPSRALSLGAGLLLLLDAACGGSGGKTASRDVLTTVQNGGIHFLAKGENCPKGGQPFEVPGLGGSDTYLIAVDQENPDDPNSPTYAVLAAQTYRDIGGVVCGPDGGPKFGNIGTRFSGNAVMGIRDSTMLVAVSLQK